MVQRAARAKPLERRSARILVVDDEPAVIRVLQRILIEHEVIVARNAMDALRHVSAGPKFDLVLCDLMMPEMTGMQLHAAMLEQVPDQAERMVFLTGGAFEPEAATFLDSTVNRTVGKPFDAAELLALVDQSIR